MHFSCSKIFLFKKTKKFGTGRKNGLIFGTGRNIAEYSAGTEYSVEKGTEYSAPAGG